MKQETLNYIFNQIFKITENLAPLVSSLGKENFNEYLELQALLIILEKELVD